MPIPHNYLIEKIKAAWSVGSSTEPQRWSPKRAYVGQELTSALVIQEFLGGDIFQISLKGVHQYWNQIPNLSLLTIGTDDSEIQAHLKSGTVTRLSRADILQDQVIKTRYWRLSNAVIQSLQG